MLCDPQIIKNKIKLATDTHRLTQTFIRRTSPDKKVIASRKDRNQRSEVGGQKGKRQRSADYAD